MADSSEFDPELLLTHKFPESTYNYDERDAALYALGIGVCARDALDDNELKYVYHENGQQFIQVLPTFATLFPSGFIADISQLPGLSYDRLLHGQQYVELYKPFPSSGCLQNKASIVGLHDKGKASIVEVEVASYEKDSGELLCKNRMTLYFGGIGGFSKSSRPFSYSKYPIDHISTDKIPQDQPFAVYEDQVQPSQALLYRLSGDYNPLHVDPNFAKNAGFPRPIVHGLCTFGFAVRAIIRCICRGDPNMVRSISGRFLLHVFLGETLITEMWLEGSRVIYQSKVKERNKAVLCGYVDLNHLASSL
ncbi:enoyl-CoA hydratase 2, peroxisomal [Malania oleifera]|uniref:enoyl-CoA hydratase 2, peroxisomal n=1 Tax=Malania oleifera TaxID=397392 RepID=UPI0025AE45DF|nr:enoyl-CoA hydratase 2, peroxisomal [Malania oleifera]XP_057974329.1 enoyl-CoA hydratase 2, peroxisomal [Malania oleifera]